jgi:hypothetical protein
MNTKILFSLGLTISSLALSQACTLTTVQNTSDAGPIPPVEKTDGGGITATGCSFGEPNDTRETAFAVTAGSYLGVCLEKSNQGDNTDFYAFTSPATDKAGGYVTVSLSNVQTTDTVIRAYDAVTNEVMPGDFHAASGESLKVWFAVRPGRKYNILVQHYVKNIDGIYDMAIGYNKVDDANEANNTREEATPITLGTDIEATFLKTQGVGAENEQVDWYKVDVSGVPAAVLANVKNVPSDADTQIKIFDSAFVEVGIGYAGKGANVTANATKADLKSGTYYFQVGTWVTDVAVMGEGEPADHLTRKYKFGVGVAVM